MMFIPVIAVGCGSPRGRSEVPPDSAIPISVTDPLLPLAADLDNAARETDVFSVHSKIGRQNDSLELRKIDAADLILEHVKKRLHVATPEELIAGFRSDRPSNGVEYYVWREGNKLIEEELVRRGTEAKAALQRHARDPRDVWTGDSGPHETVGSVCQRVLALVP